MKYVIIFAITFFLISKYSYSDTLDVPLDYTTIQLALDNAVSGDIVFVQQGLYEENLVWPEIESLKLISAGDTSNTFISGMGTGRVITIIDSLNIIDTSSFISGFSIINGYNYDSIPKGGGIYIKYADFKLENLKFSNNKIKSIDNISGVGYGSSLYVDSSSVWFNNIRFSDCIIDSCASYKGGQASILNSNVSLNNIVISNNTTSYFAYIFGLYFYIQNCEVDINNISCTNNSHSQILQRIFGVFCNFEESDVQISNINVDSNYIEVGTNSNGVYIYGTALYSKSSRLTIDEAIINNNIVHSNFKASIYGAISIYSNNSYNPPEDTVRISNVYFANNTYELYEESNVSGSCIYISNLYAWIDSVFINDNSCFGEITSISGGGLKLEGNSVAYMNEIHVENNSFIATSRCYGGGINSTMKSAYLNNSDIINNSMASNDWMLGGGIYLDNYSINDSLTNFYIENCRIDSNETGGSPSWNYGCGIYCCNQNLEINRTSISNNNCLDDADRFYGGGVYSEESKVSIYNSIIKGNRFGLGGIWYTGAAIYANDYNYNNIQTYFKIYNSTIYDNGLIGTGHSNSCISNGDDSLLIKNSILWNEPTSNIIYNNSFIDIQFSCIKDGYTGTGNIASDPLFNNLDSLTLSLTSPCINTGTSDTIGLSIPAADFYGNPRIIESRIDMGAVEFQSIINENKIVYTENEIDIFPNPVKDIIYVKSKMSDIKEISLYDINGKKLNYKFDTNSYIYKLKVSGLPQGIYLLQIRHDKGIENKKFIKE